MTKKDKIIAAFLVSIGLFSLTQAKQYIVGLSKQEKNSLMSVKEFSGNILLAVGSGAGGDGGPTQDPKRAA